MFPEVPFLSQSLYRLVADNWTNGFVWGWILAAAATEIVNLVIFAFNKYQKTKH